MSYIYYLQTQLSGMILAPHLVMYNLSLFTF